MTDLSGKIGLVVGVANKRSIAWAIAQAAAAAGARLAITHRASVSRRTCELAAGLNEPLLLPLDVTSDQQIDDTFAAIDKTFGGLDFVVHGAAFAPREAIAAPFLQTSREAFRVSLDISAHSLVALARGAAPLMEPRGGGSILTLTYLGSQRVFTNYNVMGVAKAALEATVRSCVGARRRQHSRQRDFRRAYQDARCIRHLGLFSDPPAAATARRSNERSIRAKSQTLRSFSSATPAARLRPSTDGRRRISRDRHLACTGCFRRKLMHRSSSNRAIILALAFMVTLSMFVAACGKSVGETVDDSGITAQVKTALQRP